MPVTAGVVEQRRAFAHLRTDHFPHKNVVVSRGHALVRGAFHGAQTIRNERRSTLAGIPSDSVKFVMSLLGKAIGEGALPFLQETQTEVPRPAKFFDVRYSVTQTDQNQGRFQRNGGERTDCEAMGYAVFIGNGGNGHPRGESAASVTEFFAGNSRYRTRHPFA